MTQILIILNPMTRAQTFVDPTNVSHEALDTDHRIGVVSLCGQVREPIPVGYNTPYRLSVYASPEAPKGVDCMTCLVRRAGLDRMFNDERATSGYAVPAIKIDIWVTP